jgi:hypothetical protein
MMQSLGLEVEVSQKELQEIKNINIPQFAPIMNEVQPKLSFYATHCLIPLVLLRRWSIFITICSFVISTLMLIYTENEVWELIVIIFSIFVEFVCLVLNIISFN